MRAILICILFAFLLGCSSQTPNLTESKVNNKAIKPVHMTNDDLKIVIEKGPVLDTGLNTFMGNQSIKDGDSLLSWLGGKSEIDKILIGTPHINANQQQFSESYVRKRFEKSVCFNSQVDKWHYAPYTMGTIYMENGRKINFTMYLSGIKLGEILFALP